MKKGIIQYHGCEIKITNHGYLNVYELYIYGVKTDEWKNVDTFTNACTNAMALLKATV